jgi:hypothetical protein
MKTKENEKATDSCYEKKIMASILSQSHNYPILNSYVLKTLLPCFSSALRLLGTRSIASASDPQTKWTGLNVPWILHTSLVGRKISADQEYLKGR